MSLLKHNPAEKGYTHEKSLHSTMSLLKLLDEKFKTIKQQPLHSTMSLLKPSTATGIGVRYGLYIPLCLY